MVVVVGDRLSQTTCLQRRTLSVYKTNLIIPTSALWTVTIASNEKKKNNNMKITHTQREIQACKISVASNAYDLRKFPKEYYVLWM